MSKIKTKTTENADRSPWFWVPTIYLAEGIPYMIAMTVSVVLIQTTGAFQHANRSLHELALSSLGDQTSLEPVCRYLPHQAFLDTGDATGYRRVAGLCCSDPARGRFCALLSGDVLDYGFQFRHA